MDLGCLKCGRETISEQVFCVNCLADMNKYPVLPGTVVQLPLRKDPVPVKKQPAKKRSVPPEEQIRNLKHRCRVLTLLVVLLAAIAAALVFPAAEHLLENHRKIGQNYNTVIPTEANE